MLRRNSKFIVIMVIFVMIIFFDPNTVRAWYFRDETAVDPVRVCKDGIYLGVAYEGGEDETAPVTVRVIAKTLPAGDILFDRDFELPLNPVPGEETITHSKYFTEEWDSSFAPLVPGTTLALPRSVVDDVPVVTVQDCLVFPEEPLAGSAFTYQGNLSEDGSPANGNYDFQFKLYNASTGGDQIGTTIVKNNLALSDGIFATELDFGSEVFAGSARWLEVSIRQSGSTGAYTLLSPRQPLTPVPYALSVLNTPDHDHLGQTWVGNYRPLAIEGHYTLAALLLSNDTGGGLSINSARDGIDITSEQGDGLIARTASEFGDGVSGLANSPTGTTRGVSGSSSSNSGTGVYGNANSSSGITFGVYGSASSEQGIGVYGEHSATTGTDPGIKGVTNSTSTFGRAVLGEAVNGRGVFGSSVSGIGTYGYASSTSGTNYGIVGWTESASGYAGYFQGDVHVTGDLSASGTKPFKIDHPLDPANQYLYHYAIESPQVQNVYNGVITLDADGTAVVQLPAYFEALNKGEFTYQLTPIGASMPNLHISQEIQENTFQISGGMANMKVSWTVTGLRNDPYIQAAQNPVEALKPEFERGTYLFPQGFGQPESRGLENNLLDPGQNETP
jgi:hypothetical protein